MSGSDCHRSLPCQGHSATDPCFVTACRSHTGKAFVKIVLELGHDKIDDAAKVMAILALRTMRVQTSIHNADAVAAATHTLCTMDHFELPAGISSMRLGHSFTVDLACVRPDVYKSIVGE